VKIDTACGCHCWLVQKCECHVDALACASCWYWATSPQGAVHSLPAGPGSLLLSLRDPDKQVVRATRPERPEVAGVTPVFRPAPAQQQEVTAIGRVLLPPLVAARPRFGEPGPPTNGHGRSPWHTRTCLPSSASMSPLRYPGAHAPGSPDCPPCLRGFICPLISTDGGDRQAMPDLRELSSGCHAAAKWGGRPAGRRFCNRLIAPAAALRYFALFSLRQRSMAPRRLLTTSLLNSFGRNPQESTTSN